MTDSFDPYLKWLGIREPQRPVNHYRLLGLDQFENDLDVINVAAQRQIRHVETFADGPHSDVCQLILSELESAKRCLLNPQARSAYDQQLRGQAATTRIMVHSGGHDKSVEPEPLVNPVGRAINSGRSRRRPNRALADFFGWLLGAVGAVVFAFIILNTNLIDRIRGRTDQSSEIESAIKLEKSPSAVPLRPVESDLANPRSAGRNIRKNPATERNPSSKPRLTEKPGSTDSELNTVADNQPTAVAEKPESELLPLPTANPLSESKNSTSGKLAIPDSQTLAESLKKIEAARQAQFNSNNINFKRNLAQSLLTNSSTASKPEEQYAMLAASANVASGIGELNTLVAAIQSMDQRFDIDFWKILEPLASAAISANVDLEPIGSGLIEIFELARDQQQFELLEKFSDRAGKVAQKQGDALQREMLADFARDMKALETLRKRYEALVPVDNISKNPQDNLTIGTYWCYCRNDWEQGLPFLAKCSDRQLAAIAALELQLRTDSAVDNSSVANEWFNLRTNSKYRGMARRCMSQRALHHYESGASVDDEADPLAVRNKILLQRETQVVKQFVNKPQVIASRTFVFNVSGQANFDAAQLERGTVLRLGLGGQSRILPVKAMDQKWQATTNDQKMNFQIRLMEFDMVEMRVYDTSSGSLLNILYGNGS